MVGPSIPLFIYGDINCDDGLQKVVQLWNYTLFFPLKSSQEKNVTFPGT